MGEHGALKFCSINLTSVDHEGRPRFNCYTVPLVPTEDEMRAAKVDPAHPLAAQAVMTAHFGLLIYDGQRWRQPK